VKPAALLVPAAAAVLLVAGCGGDDRTTGPTVPERLTPGTTLLAPGHGSTGDGGDDTGSTVPGAVSPDGPAATGAPVVEQVTAEPASVCEAGTTPLTVRFTLRADPPARVVTVVLDGETAGSTSDGSSIVVPALPCDGNVHTVLLVATGADGLSGTGSVAIRAPRG
jgi:hypothetical protein